MSADGLPSGTRPTLKWLKRGLLFALLVFAGLVIFLLLGPPSASGVPSVNVSHARYLFLTLKLYAKDHQGQYPPTLSALAPDYLSAEELAKWAYRDATPGHHHDWLYHAGVRDDSPAHWIVISSPYLDVPADGMKPTRRVVVRNDGSAIFMAEPKYQQTLAEQRKGLH